MTHTAKRGLLIAGILGLAVAAAVGLSKLKPPPETREIADVDPLVDVLPLEATTEQFVIVSQGTVAPRTETILSAEVSGSIVDISAKFIAGGVFAAGEELLRIDPVNYEVGLEQAQATLAQRQIEFDGASTLRSQGYRAESEYASAAAALATARAELVKAERNLERTRISLPYAGMVRSKAVDLGQYVNPGTRLGVTFATDFAEVRLPLTDQDLAFVDLPDAADIRASGAAAGPMVELSAVQRGETRTWSAQIVRTEGVVDEKNRVTYAVAHIRDPYGLDGNSGNATPLPMGTFVAAQIDGMTVADVVRVPRIALRANNQLMFVDADDRIRLAPVEVIRADANHAYLRSSSLATNRISMTALQSPINGMKVRTTEAAPEDDRQDDEDPAHLAADDNR